MSIAGDASFVARSDLGTWLIKIVVFAGWATGAYLAAMIVWVVVPTAILGWSPHVIVSGSMEPVISTGDIVLVEPVIEPVGPGTIVAFDDGRGTVIHRVAEAKEDGTYVTRGDANSNPDSDIVEQTQIVGQGRLLIPYLGLARTEPGIWWGAVAVLGAMALVLWRNGAGVALTISVGMLTVTGMTVATAAFAFNTSNGSSTINTLTIEAPTNLDAACTSPLGLGDVAVELNWSASVSPATTGYRVFHDEPGGPVTFIEVGSVGPGTTTFTHDIVVALLGLGNHSYIVRAEVGSWTSSDSNIDTVDVVEAGVGYACIEL